MRLKIEINTREHFSVFGVVSRSFHVENPWFTGKTDIISYQLEELLGTKLCALYQRKKGRDLFDLWFALTAGQPEPARIIDCFMHYMDQGKSSISRARFEENLLEKIEDRVFLEDVLPLLPADLQYDPHEAAKLVIDELLSNLPGDPWRGASRTRL